jgi:hypothetical protein
MPGKVVIPPVGINTYVRWHAPIALGWCFLASPVMRVCVETVADRVRPKGRALYGMPWRTSPSWVSHLFSTAVT